MQMKEVQVGLDLFCISGRVLLLVSHYQVFNN